ncbi:4-hydroxy-tetrahydrodipicolinate synthase [Arthrobacter sp. I2-34]|uniref:4-hydroxy-tetrahydrodipicolinate synthase n=1 Tax=Arthrobacter hankyongi TaxID=2904801 RepID=A0ABS9L4V3_9MICC|nr:4-hydroxy-tetrahydrodipicolinate synthase [Arthrobacter hankyongi]MCG2621709.1 4-hydroxy-tetrahydrodipicolinate synthase [Arthrobacter hankyongi]
MTTIENFGNSAASKGYRAFGSVLTAMVTPFDRHGGLDEFGAEKLAAWLTQDGWNDGVVVNGTTGESVTTSDREKIVMIESAKRALERRGKKVIAGVGAGDTRHSVAMAEAAAAHGADGLLVVAPYYSRPTQAGILQHFRAIADSTPLPVMLYDHPGRTGVALEPDTLAAAAEHPRIIAVKDAKGDLEASSWVMRRTYLSYYSGDDALNLPLLSIGAVGMVSVVGHLVGDRLRSLLDHYSNGRIGEALALHRELLPVCRGMFRAPAAASVKAALKSLGLPAGPVRSPLVDLDQHETQALLADMTSTGVLAPLPA